MELLQLRYFLEVAERQHLNKTAQEMLVTPSAISSSLARLEKEIGVKLFDRVGRNIRLNRYGKIFQTYAKQVFTALDNAQAEIREAQNLKGCSISVAVTNPILWNHSLSAFSMEHPEISVSLIAFDTGKDADRSKYSDPEEEDIDFYIATTGALINPKYAFQSELLLNAQVFLAVPPAHRFSGRTEIDLAEARDEWFVNSPHNTSFRIFCDELCQKAGFTPKSRIECDYILRPHMLISEKMVCIATSIGQRSGLYDGTVMIPIVNPLCTRPQAIYWRANSHMSKSAQIFLDFIVDYCSKL